MNKTRISCFGKNRDLILVVSNETTTSKNTWITVSDLVALASDPDITIDVTRLDLGLLPKHVKADLYTKSSGHISTNRATSFHAPQLKTAREINSRSATRFDITQLKTVGDIHADWSGPHF